MHQLLLICVPLWKCCWCNLVNLLDCMEVLMCWLL